MNIKTQGKKPREVTHTQLILIVSFLSHLSPNAALLIHLAWEASNQQ